LIPGGLGRVVGVAIALVAVIACSVAARAAFGVSVVDGGSMRPALEPADILITERHPRRVAAGDVVVFSRAGWSGGVAHRVTAVLPGGLLTTRGDANPVPDRDPIGSEAIVGRVVARVPSGALARRVASTVGFVRTLLTRTITEKTRGGVEPNRFDSSR